MTSGRKRKERRAKRLANPVPTPEVMTPEPHVAGVLGDGVLHPGKHNMRIVQRGIRDDWPIAPEVRRVVMNQMAIVVGRSIDERNRIGAARVLVMADAVNAGRERLDQANEHHQDHIAHPAESISFNVGVAVAAPQSVQAIGQAAIDADPRYLEWIRGRAIAQSGNPDVVGSNGFAATIPHAAPRTGDGSGGDGHDQGD